MNMKKKLVAATAMMLISALMLTSVSFAWVTLSTNPEVKGITATAAANGNLEIALNDDLGTVAAPTDDVNATSYTNDNYAYGNLVQFSTTAATGSVTLPAVVLRQAVFNTTGDGISTAKTAGAVTTAAANNSFLQTYNYGTDGRKSTKFFLTDNAYSAVDAEKGYSIVRNGAAASDVAYAVRFDYWLRTNETGKLDLSTAVSRDSENTAWTGAGSYIEIPDSITKSAAHNGDATVKVAFVITDTYNDTSSIVSDTITYTALTQAETGTDPIPDGYTRYILRTGESGLLANMVADHNYLVQMYLYLDGTSVTNAMLNDADTTGIKVNVQFDNSSIDNPMQ